MNVIELHDVAKSYQGRTLYQHVDAVIPAGSITALVGPNGSGKSVLFKLMIGFVRPDAGEVLIDATFQSPGRTFPESFGVIIDRPGYLAHLTGFENLRLLARIRKQITDTEIRDAMRSVGLEPDLKQKVRNYSLGMKQKLALAQAMMERPKVLVLDEPFNALDHDAVAVLRTLLLDFRSRGNTVVFTSHNPEDVDVLADRVLELRAERLVTVEQPAATATAP